ncbi:hypothetical protein Pan44_55660 [Caulifigura coniformis]|uniref:Uncharacterized protein n=1 Tax=Caulifigura coniformis TaxID=2527983 RepID=A0A517SMZ2_9PLAN|nr:hypothetical protein Pan44_55660 [Caulifigura coniformis]
MLSASGDFPELLTSAVPIRRPAGKFVGMNTNSIANWLVFLFALSTVFATGTAIGGYFGSHEAGAIVTSALLVLAVSVAFRKGSQSSEGTGSN